VEVDLHLFLTSAMDGQEWSASRFFRWTSRVGKLGLHFKVTFWGQKGCECFGENKNPLPLSVIKSLFFGSYTLLVSVYRGARWRSG
jgi:hypothetical protein